MKMAMTKVPQEGFGSSNNKLLGLEVIRFVTAIAVLLWHYQHFAYVGDKPTGFIREQQPLYSILHIFYDYGRYGVQVFWCISGFIFFWKYKNVIADKIISGKMFFMLRFSRLYPLHITTLLLVVILQLIYFNHNNQWFVYQNNDYKHLCLNLFLASNWGFEKGVSFNGPIWSISVEVLVYFLFFLTLRFIGKSVTINIVVLLLCAIAEFAKISSPILDCLACFYIGGLSAIALQHFENTTYQKLLSALSLYVVIIAPLILYCFNLYEIKHIVPLFLIIYTPILLYFSSRKISLHQSIQKFIEAAGNMTYSSYLIHFPIQLSISLYYSFINKPIPLYDLVFFIIFMVITLVTSFLIFHYFEMPVQAVIRNKFK